MNYLQYSESESEAWGIKIGRGARITLPEIYKLETEIYAKKFDWVRIKVDASDESVFEKIRKIRMPWSIHSIIIRNQFLVSDIHQSTDSYSGFDFELFTGLQCELLKNLVSESVISRTAVNFLNPFIAPWVESGAEAKAAAFYASQFNNLLEPEKWCWIVKEQGFPVGFVMGETSGDIFEGLLYGVIPAFRGKKISRKIMRFLIDFCRENRITFFENDVVMQNLPSLRNIIAEGSLPVKTYFNISLNPLLSVPGQEILSKKFPQSDSSPEIKLLQICLEYFPKNCGAPLIYQSNNLANQKTPFYLEVEKLENNFRFVGIRGKILNLNKDIISYCIILG